MNCFQHMLKSHDRDHILTIRRLQFTLDCIGENDLEAARAEIMEAYRAAKKTDAAFRELSLLVGVLLNELQQVNDELGTLPVTRARESRTRDSHPTPTVIPGGLFDLLKRLYRQEKLPF